MSDRNNARTVAELLSEETRSSDSNIRNQAAPTGFNPLDEVLGGGLRTSHLALIAGRPGIGKTILALQWARSFAISGRKVVFICFEHSPRELLERLLSLEVRSAARSDEQHLVDAAISELRDSILKDTNSSGIENDPIAQEALRRLGTYSSLLTLIPANGRTTDLDAIQAIASEAGEGSVIFVDYLQKVPVKGAIRDDERAGIIAEALKDIAMNEQVVMVATAAGDKAGIAGRRFRLADLRGSSSLAHECDVAIMLNEKTTAISKVALTYNTSRSAGFDRQLIFSIEKNRIGPSNMHLEFTKDFRYFRFDPEGGFLAEKMMDEALYEE